MSMYLLIEAVLAAFVAAGVAVAFVLAAFGRPSLLAALRFELCRTVRIVRR